MNCLRCNHEMNYLGKEYIQFGKTGWITGDLPNLLAGALLVDLYVCSFCRKIEIFMAENISEENTLPQKTCPCCGTAHDFDYPKCPKCKYEYS